MLFYFDVLIFLKRCSDTVLGLIKFYLRRLSSTNKLKIQCQKFVRCRSNLASYRKIHGDRQKNKVVKLKLRSLHLY